MIETWVTEEGWGSIREGWKKGFRWVIQGAVRERGRGRAKGGMAFGVKEGIEEGDGVIELGEEGWLERKVRLGGEWWWIVGVYVNGDLERKKELMSRWMEREGGERVVIGGDMNVRTGREGGGWEGRREEEMGGGRRSRDEVVTKEGKDWCRFVNERGWRIVNGCVEGDREGEWTFIGGRGKSVIDYVVVGERVWEKVVRLEVVSRVDSDHLPVVIWLRVKERKRSRGKERGQEKREGRGVWTERGVEKFRAEFGGWEWTTEGVEEGWEKMRENKESDEEIGERKGGEEGKRVVG